ncbi:uncharacterized protein Dvar_54570 [Desulfosarcina variabilis str. Montpellier]
MRPSFEAFFDSCFEELSLQRRASTILRVWSKWLVVAIKLDAGRRIVAVELPSFRSVQSAGMSDRLPSGRTSVKFNFPSRCVHPRTCRDCPCNGCRLRIISTL